MNSQIFGLRIAGLIFGLMALGQLTRVLLNIEVLIAGHPIPLWPSAAAVLVLACLSFWLWRLSFSKPHGT